MFAQAAEWRTEMNTVIVAWIGFVGGEREPQRSSSTGRDATVGRRTRLLSINAIAANDGRYGHRDQFQIVPKGPRTGIPQVHTHPVNKCWLRSRLDLPDTSEARGHVEPASLPLTAVRGFLAAHRPGA